MEIITNIFREGYLLAKRGIYCTCLLFCTFLFSASINSNSLEKCFKRSGAEIVYAEVEGHGFINTNNTTDIVAKDLIKKYGFSGNYEINKSSGDTRINFKDAKTEGNITVRNVPGKNIVYVSFRLSPYKDYRNINNIRGRVADIFKYYNMKPSFSSLIEGKYNGNIKKTEKIKIATDIIVKDGGLMYDSINNDNLFSCSGFLPGIKDRTSSGNRLININIALRYSPSDDCTYIWIGSPTITSEY